MSARGISPPSTTRASISTIPPGRACPRRRGLKALAYGETLEVCGVQLEILPTPGHTPGGVCLYARDEGVLFSGDTLFCAGYGRVDFPGSSAADMRASLLRLFALPGETRVFPGHGGGNDHRAGKGALPAMTIRVFTPETGFIQDMADVLRLFYGGAPIFFGEEGEADLRVEHHVSRREGRWCDQFSGGPISVFRVQGAGRRRRTGTEAPAQRSVKLALYEYCKKLTGVHPPWGSLTGIRPSRLYYEALEEGLDPVRTLTDVFDVTEDRARLLDEMHEMQTGLRTPPKDSFDVYIGIPFCKTARCAYCSFSSGEIGDGRLVAPYVEALKREIALSAQIAARKGFARPRLYVGGGTPTAIPREALEEVLLAAREAFPGAVEQTVEAGRPDTIDRPMLEMLLRAGTTRISVNPQTFNDETLRRIGPRAHGAGDHRGLSSRPRGGLYQTSTWTSSPPFRAKRSRTSPHAGKDGFPRPRKRHRARAGHQAFSRLHEQMHVEGGGHGLTPANEAEKMTALARETLARGGWKPYYLYRQKYMAGNLENVGYASAAWPACTNIGNMEETASVLALGAGAITKCCSTGARRIERAPNVKNIEAYIDRVEEMAARNGA